MAGWGNVLGKIFDWLPGREEAIRNSIDKIKKEMNEIEKQPSSADSTIRYARLAAKLRIEESKLQNR